MIKQYNPYWHFESEPNPDGREGVNVYIVHKSGDCASLACADNEGETADGRRIPAQVVKGAWDWIESAGLDY